MTTKRKTRTTTKAATKPGRKPGRKARTTDKPQADESPQDIAQAVGQALGRTLADLLGGNAPAAAVHLWTAERRTIGGEDAIVCAAQQEARPVSMLGLKDEPTRSFPFGGPTGDALVRVMAAVDNAEALAYRAEARLSPVLTPSPAAASPAKGIGNGPPNWVTITHLLHDIADRLNAINSHQADTIDRLEV